MINDKEYDDDISITDQDVPFMLAKISYKPKGRTSDLSSILSLSSDSTDNEEDDGIAADLSTTTHYCNGGGSAGHCSQSNMSSHRESCTSTTVLSTDI